MRITITVSDIWHFNLTVVFWLTYYSGSGGRTLVNTDLCRNSGLYLRQYGERGKSQLLILYEDVISCPKHIACNFLPKESKYASALLKYVYNFWFLYSYVSHWLFHKVVKPFLQDLWFGFNILPKHRGRFLGDNILSWSTTEATSMF